MPVTAMFQASDGKLFVDRNEALAYDATLTRRARVIARLRATATMKTDTGNLKSTVEMADVLDWLVRDATWIRTVGSV